jgi:hypothetical protein
MRGAHRLAAVGTIGLVRHQLNYFWPHHRQLLDVLHHLPAFAHSLSTLRTRGQRNRNLLIHMIGNRTKTARMAFLAPRFFRVTHMQLVANAKGSGLAGGGGLQLIHLCGKPVIAVIEVVDLFLEPGEFLLQLIESFSLAQNNFDEFVGAIPQRLQHRLQ